MIKTESIEEVKDAAEIVAVISDYVDLKKSGSSLSGCCPFHNERTPSFTVNPVKGFFKCFGCGKAGDSIKFIQEHKRVSFIEAIKILASKFSINLQYDSLHTVEEEEEGKKADSTANVAQEYFIKSLAKHPEATEYLKSRKYSADLIAEFEIGFAPNEWQGLTPKIVDLNLYEVANKMGLVRRNEEKARNFDGIMNRITIPIRNHFGRLVGFAGRLLPEKEVEPVVEGEEKKTFPKYINPPDSKFYHKDRILFGLDKAKKSIIESQTAMLVEGYFDVISLHGAAISNAVASCGTAFTSGQAKLLKKYCSHLIVSYDNDAAGIKATKTAIEIALTEGFKVDVFFSPAKDNDDWIRSLSDRELDIIPLVISDNKEDGIMYLADQWMKNAGDAHDENKAIEQITTLLALIPAEGIRDSYVKNLVKKYKYRASIFKDLLKKAVDAREDMLMKEERRTQSQAGIPTDYTLPAEVASKVKWNEIQKDVEEYAIFFAGNKTFSRRGTGDSFYTFKEVSNFKIRIIQHMEDEKNPMKLVEIENVHHRKRTFDARSEDFTNPDSFNKMVTKFGNYNWQGEKTDFQRLITKLYDEMGDGRIIHVMGWQPESFFAFANAILLTDGTVMEVDQNGCFTLNGASYYIPAGNSVHASAANFLFHQKRVVYQKSSVSLQAYFHQIKVVHREHAMNAILFSIATVFSDIIYDRASFFPLLFLYGEASSGKDQLIEACQSFFGKTQSALTITGRANTDKAKIRKFAQMRNMIVHMSEYKNGSEDTDLLLMGLWDRRGYERANIDSGVGTDTVPILSSVMFTSNEYPTYDPLITRFIAEEMNKVDFSQQEKLEYEKLKEIIHGGVSSIMEDILKMRSLFENKFRTAYKEVSSELKYDLSSLNLKDRMIGNSAVLGATLKLCMEAGIPLPFTFGEWKNYMISKNLERQSNKMNTGSVVSKWWDCFLDGCRTGKELIAGRDYRVDGNSIFINFKAAFNNYQQVHFKLNRSAGLSKAVMQDKLKKDSTQFIAEHSVIRFGHTRSSAYEFNLDKTGIKDDIISIMEHLEVTRKRYSNSGGQSSSNSEETEDLLNPHKSTELVSSDSPPF